MRPKAYSAPVGGGLSVDREQRAQVGTLAVAVVRAGEHGVALAAAQVRLVPERGHARRERLRVVRRDAALLACELGRCAERRHEHRHAGRHRLERGVAGELVIARGQQQHRRRGELAAELLAIEPAEEAHRGAEPPGQLLELLAQRPLASDVQRHRRARGTPRSRCRSPSRVRAARPPGRAGPRRRASGGRRPTRAGSAARPRRARPAARAPPPGRLRSGSAPRSCRPL